MGPEVEQALRELDERTKGALAATNTALWELDLARRAVTWSANLDALFKRPIDNLEKGLQAVHPADEPRVRAACMATIEDHRDYRVECRVLWPDGTVRWVVSEGRVAKAAHGKPPRLIGNTIDVTDRRTLEDQLRQSQKVEAIGRFARGIAHDFNNLLTVIQGYSQLLADKVSDPKQAAEMREVLQAADRARALTRELLAFSRPQALEPKAAGAPARIDAAGAPARLDAAGVHAGANVSDVPAAPARKVLVIEDQAAVRALVRRILEREGFGVLEAEGSSGAERLFDEHRADIALILADVGIPGEKGPALFRRLASKKPELKVVYMSGQIEETAFTDESQGRHERFLAKPFTAAGLITAVKEALRE